METELNCLSWTGSSVHIELRYISQIDSLAATRAQNYTIY